MGYADFRCMNIFSSYSVKSNYFCIILNLLRLIICQIIVFCSFTKQLLSIVTRKRGGKRRAKHHCTDVRRAVNRQPDFRSSDSWSRATKKTTKFEFLCWMEPREFVCLLSVFLISKQKARYKRGNYRVMQNYFNHHLKCIFRFFYNYIQFEETDIQEN